MDLTSLRIHVVCLERTRGLSWLLYDYDLPRGRRQFDASLWDLDRFCFLDDFLRNWLLSSLRIQQVRVVGMQSLLILIARVAELDHLFKLVLVAEAAAPEEFVRDLALTVYTLADFGTTLPVLQPVVVLWVVAGKAAAVDELRKWLSDDHGLLLRIQFLLFR